MAMSGSSLAARWKAKLAPKFKGTYNDAFMAEMAQCIVDEIKQNMVITTAVSVSTSTGLGSGNAGNGKGKIE